jgi:hypothetical protein
VTRRWPVAAVVLATMGATTAAAQPGLDDRTTAAATAADAGDWATVERLLAPVVADPHVAPGERAEAHRLLGLAALARRDPAAAEAQFLAYLKLDLDGRLDPALYPPETVAFLEDVRGRHAALLRSLRPKPKARRSWALNLLPPAGQFQNGHRTKAWTLAVIGGTALLANVGSYILLRSWCDDDGTCDHSDSARALRQVNLGAAAVFGGAYLYGMWDGFRHFRRTSEVSVAPVAYIGGGGLVVRLTY